MKPKTKPMKAYKVFNPDWTCNGFQYEAGKTYEMKDEPILCKRGFHACKKVQDCFSYYSFDPKNKVAEVELMGVILGEDNDKQVCNKIKIVKEITWEEMLVLANTGKSNSGHSNSGDSNSGHRNTGDRNSGDWNTGGWNTGDRNSGDRNSGDWNTGGWNTGDRNSGDSNTGGWNTGDRNSGDRNSGDWNTGGWNTGDRNSGDSNSGDWNTGDSNSGDRNSGHSNYGGWNSGDSNSGERNSGDWNTGRWNTGYSNSGERNTGHSNSGDSNSGHRNSGDRNSGDWNSGDWNSGCFNSITPEKILVFNKPCKRKVWDNAEKPDFIFFQLTKWIQFYNMTKEEKENNPQAEVMDGYLKTLDYKEAWAEAYRNANKKDIVLLKALPNFDAKVFEEITGIDVNQ